MNKYVVAGTGEIRSVDLDFADSNILDLGLANQFKKTCSSSQEFIIVNEDLSVFKLILTGGSLNSSLFKHSTKPIGLVWENGAISDYSSSVINRIYCTIEEIEPSIKIILSIANES